jgi:hydrogenase expression/formation protein HypC
MCVAMPGRVVSIDKNKATVDFSGSTVQVEMGLVKAKVGDFVLVHAGCAVEVLNEDRARDILDLLSEIEELADGKN